MSTLARNETREQLRYNYTPDERREKGQALADALNRLSVEEANLDRIKSDYKAKLTTIEGEVGKLKDSVLSGYELREYVCFWVYDDPKPGRKTLRRKEPPQDIVREEDMTEADRQTVMEEIEKSATEQQPAADGKIVPKEEVSAIPFPEIAVDDGEFTPEARVFFDSFDFSVEQCVGFAKQLRHCYTEADGKSSDKPEIAEAFVSNLLRDLGGEKTPEVVNFLEWLEEIPRPGGRRVAGLLRAAGVKTRYEREEAAKVAKAKTKVAAKSAGRKARMVSSDGVVATEADGDVNIPEDEHKI